MKKIVLIVFIVFSVSQIFSQNTDSIIAQITRNNTTLKALAKMNSADSLGNLTDIYLQNPEIGFNYLFGSPSNIGKRSDFSISQSFDFPTAYVYKNQISDLKNKQLYYSYQREYKEIVLQTKLICIDLIYYNLLIKEYSKRYEHAKKIAASYKSKFDIGDVNILEYNKAELNKLNTAKNLEELKIEKRVLLDELIGLNANKALTFSDTVFFENQIPLNYKQWYEEAESRNPFLTWLKMEVEQSEKSKKLSKAQSLPKLSAGYMSEFTAGQNFQGLSFGISIPLWENKNKIKYAEMKTEAMQNYVNSNKLKYYNSLSSLYTKAISLQQNVNEYETNLKNYNNSLLLYKALEKGEIDLINYIMELSFYYESKTNLLSMKRELQKVIARLNKY